MNQTNAIQQLIYRAVRELYIDVPVYKVDDLGDHIRLYLYGGGVVDYPKPAGSAPSRPAKIAPIIAKPASTQPSPDPAKPGFREGAGAVSKKPARSQAQARKDS